MKNAPNCHGSGQINVCNDCGKPISEKYDLCRDCTTKRKEDRMKRDKIQERENEVKDVYVLRCIMSNEGYGQRQTL